jgi:hypothetical protein
MVDRFEQAWKAWKASATANQDSAGGAVHSD